MSAPDLIYGAHLIARVLGIPRSRVYALKRDGAPLFKLKDADRSPLCARRAELAAWLSEREAAARDGAR